MSKPGKTGGRLAEVSHFFLSRVEDRDEEPSPGTAASTPVLRSRENTREAIWISSVVSGVPSAFLTANLAIALSRRGQRVRIMDLENGNFTVPTALGVSPAYSELFRAYVLEGSITASTVEGPEGIEIVSILPEGEATVSVGDDRMVLVNIPSDQDISASGGTAIVFARADPQGLLAAYEWLKAAAEQGEVSALGAILSAPGGESAKDGFEHLSSACRRFLGRSFSYFGSFPSEASPSIHHSLSIGCPLTSLSPESEAAAAFTDMAERICVRTIPQKTAEPEIPAASSQAARARPRPRVDVL